MIPTARHFTLGLEVDVYETRDEIWIRTKVWNNPAVKWILILVSGLLLIGCGPSEKVTIGEPDEKGVLQKDIDQSKDTAAQATQKVKEGDKDAFGS